MGGVDVDVVSARDKPFLFYFFFPINQCGPSRGGWWGRSIVYRRGAALGISQCEVCSATVQPVSGA